MVRAVSDTQWFAIRAAARRLDFDEVARMARELGMPIVAHHARRATFDRVSLGAVWWGLLLDQPDSPDPFAQEGGRRGA
jgi:hypothetical protein